MERNGEIKVVKVGSSSVSTNEKGLNNNVIDSVAEQLSFLWNVGKKVVLVSSGAVAAGRSRQGGLGLEFNNRPTRSSLMSKKVSAIFGQSRLIAAYDKAFERNGVWAGQVLLTGDDLVEKHADRLESLWESMYDGIPVVNANDPLNNHEMKEYEKARDNDQLAEDLARRLNANRLIILTNTSGILDRNNNDRRISSITSEGEYEATMRMILQSNGVSEEGTGGMSSKLHAGWSMVRRGAEAWIVQASERDIIMKIMDGESVGTHLYLPVQKTDYRS
jgi:glutamate 5-kinase